MLDSGSAYKIVKYISQYKSGVIDLLKYMWNEYDENGRYKLFKWRYEDNPYEEPIIFLAVEKDLVIGFRAFIAQLFVKGDRQYIVFSPADTIIHRDHRRKGIISALNDKCIEEINMKYQNKDILLINTSTSKPSMPVYLKQGWKKSNGLRRFYFKHSLINYLYSSINGNTKIFTPEVIEVNTKAYKIVVSKEVNSKELSVFSLNIKNPNRWTNIRDTRFFDWRYNFLPEKYYFIYCYHENSLQGYLIIKKSTDKKYALDQFEAVNNKVFKALVHTAYKILKIVQLRSYAFLPEEKNLLMRNGFLPEPIALLKSMGIQRFPILVRPKNPQPEETDFIVEGRDIRDINNWHLQVSDRH